MGFVEYIDPRRYAEITRQGSARVLGIDVEELVQRITGSRDVQIADLTDEQASMLCLALNLAIDERLEGGGLSTTSS